jgi:undecaprenyl-diphosphatase
MFSKIDRAAYRIITSRPDTRLRGFSALVTHLGDGVLWGIVYGLLLVLAPRNLVFPVWTLVVGEAAALSIVVVLRYAFRRPRPDPSYRPSRLAPWNRYSFPSHHSLRVFLIVVVVGIRHRFLLPWLLLPALTVALSRVALSRHYLSDVVVGALLGAGIGLFCLRLFPLTP